jgi:hypothetical protein
VSSSACAPPEGPEEDEKLSVLIAKQHFSKFTCNRCPEPPQIVALHQLYRKFALF